MKLASYSIQALSTLQSSSNYLTSPVFPTEVLTFTKPLEVYNRQAYSFSWVNTAALLAVILCISTLLISTHVMFSLWPSQLWQHITGKPQFPPTFPNFSDFSLTNVKFNDFSRRGRWAVTALYSSNSGKWLKQKTFGVNERCILLWTRN